MNILIIEDDPQNIESAKQGVARNLGNGHTIDVVQTAIPLRSQGYLEKIASRYYSLVLTDLYLPAGNEDGWASHTQPDVLVSAGSIVFAIALAHDVPIILSTDVNGHKDMLGLLLEYGSHKPSHRKLAHVNTRCEGPKRWFHFGNARTERHEIWERFLEEHRLG